MATDKKNLNYKVLELVESYQFQYKLSLSGFMWIIEMVGSCELLMIFCESVVNILYFYLKTPLFNTVPKRYPNPPRRPAECNRARPSANGHRFCPRTWTIPSLFSFPSMGSRRNSCGVCRTWHQGCSYLLFHQKKAVRGTYRPVVGPICAVLQCLILLFQ
jgi:hypothetical protein